MGDMREPSLDEDGWRLLNAEERQQTYPGSFELPDLRIRNALTIGDYAKLLFEIGVSGDETDEDVVERMWVIVRETLDGRYIGVLDNKPDSIAENDRLWLGVEVPFGPEHVIDAQIGDVESAILAAKEPLRRWSR